MSLLSAVARLFDGVPFLTLRFVLDVALFAVEVLVALGVLVLVENAWLAAGGFALGAVATAYATRRLSRRLRA